MFIQQTRTRNLKTMGTTRKNIYLVSGDGPVNKFLNPVEEPECFDTELIACMEVVEKRKEEKAAHLATLQ